MATSANPAAASSAISLHDAGDFAANTSAVDVSDAGAISILDIPHKLTSERVRRRSELARAQPPTTPGVLEPQSFELPVIEEVRDHARSAPDVGTSASASGVLGPADVVFRLDADPRDRDVEIAPSFPNSLAPSVRFEEETGSTVSLSPAQRREHKRRNLVNFATLCTIIFFEGWNDGTTGPLLPRVQGYYNIGFAVVSLIFVFNTIGFISGAFVNVWLTDKLGFGWVLLLGSVLQTGAYALLALAGPFPLMCIAFVLIGFGLSLQNAHCNGFVAASPENVVTRMGILHASYGLGALISPLVATQFAAQKHWSFHYLISLALYTFNTSLIWFVFRGKRQEVVKAEAGETFAEQETVASSKYKQLMGLREVHFLCAFALIYVGVEVTIGSWSVTYVQERRDGSSSTGYISSGFFAGLMLGRIGLMWLNQKIGERLALFVYAFIAIQLEVTVWVVPSLIENAVAVALVGMLLGPMYPILMNHTTKILPRWLLTGAMGYIAGVGQAGSAVLPFLTGLLASKFGISSLQPFIVSMMSTMIVVWAVIPRVRHVPT